MPCLYGGVAIVAVTITTDPPQNNTHHVITTGDTGGISLPLVENQHTNSFHNVDM